MRRYDIALSYLFLLPSVVGVAGLHRFYLGKPLTGMLYLVTLGFVGIGTIYDALTMPRLVRRARNRERLARILDGEIPGSDDLDARYPGEGARSFRLGGVSQSAPARDSGHGRDHSRFLRPRLALERTILVAAEERHGIVTPGRIAIAGGVSVERARTALDRLVRLGFADAVVSSDGGVFYVFPEFVDEDGRNHLDSLT
ncbi:MAG: TM2 domain-containing protein [Alkalispirochaeta sp.]